MDILQECVDLQGLRKEVGDYVWLFYIGMDKMYYWEVSKGGKTTLGRSHRGFLCVDDCLDNASINGYSNVSMILDCWEFYYCGYKGYKWVHLSTKDGGILGESYNYFETRYDCVANAKIFGF